MSDIGNRKYELLKEIIHVEGEEIAEKVYSTPEVSLEKPEKLSQEVINKTLVERLKKIPEHVPFPIQLIENQPLPLPAVNYLCSVRLAPMFFNKVVAKSLEGETVDENLILAMSVCSVAFKSSKAALQTLNSSIVPLSKNHIY